MYQMQEQSPDFHWPTYSPAREVSKYFGATAKSALDALKPQFVDHMGYSSPPQDYYHGAHYDPIPRLGEDVLTTTIIKNSPTEPNLLATVTSTMIETVTTGINDVISDVTSPATTLGASNQSGTQGLFNADTVTADIFTTVVSNVSSVTPTIDVAGAVDTNQTVVQTTLSDILTSLSSNVTSVTAGIADAADANNTATEAVTNGAFNTETTLRDVITEFSSTVSNISTGRPETTTTVGSIVQNATDAVVKHATEIFTTSSSDNNGHDHYEGIDQHTDITIYIILGVIIALLVLGMIVFYFVCKKCKTRHAKSGDYYVTQYTSNSSC